MKLGTNIPALSAIRNMKRNEMLIGETIGRISSGKSILKAKDDAAGHSISEKMKLQIIGLRTASKNSLDAVSLIQTGEGALNEMHAMIQRMRELAVQSANGTNTQEDRAAIQKEVDELTSEVNKIAHTTDFNGIKLLDGNTAPMSNAYVSKMSCGKPYKIELKASTTLTGDEEIFIDLTEGPNVEKVELNLKDIGNFPSPGVGVDPKTDKKAELLKRVQDAVGDRANAYYDTENRDNIIIESKSVGGDSSIKFSGKDVDKLIDAGKSKEEKSEKPEYGRSATGSITFKQMPEHRSVITIGTKTIGFYDSTKGKPGSNTIEIDISGKKDLPALPAIPGSAGVPALTGGIKDEKSLVDRIIQEYNYVEAKSKINSAYTLDGLKLTAGTGTNKNSKYSINIEAPEVGENGERYIVKGQETYKDVPIQFGGKANDMVFLELDNLSSLNLKLSSYSKNGNARVLDAGYSENKNITGKNIKDKTEFALDVSSSHKRASSAIKVYDNAIARVSEVRSRMGAIQNRLERTITNLDSAAENVTESMSRLSDADLAEEFTRFTNSNILAQAANAMLAQANQYPAMIMKLLEN